MRNRWLPPAGLLLALIPPPQAWAQVEVMRQVHLMGTVATLRIWSGHRQEGLARLERLIAVLEETESELSTWREQSVLSGLNRHPLAREFPLDERLCRLAGDLFYWWKETKGAFDPSVGELIRAWGIRGEGRRPLERELERARLDSGLEHLVFDETGCTLLRRRPVRVDAGAFGKGEALRRVGALAGAEAMGPWLVDLGGQVAVGGGPPSGRSWSVALAHPLDRARAVVILDLPSGSLATSGDSERAVWVEGERLSHILDPRNGRPAEFGGSVTLWHEDPLVADVLSTALFVMGPDRGWGWAEERGLAALFLIPEGPRAPLTIRTTRFFRQRFPGMLIP